mmetsp:Transcript_14311/g.21588  ORF Transcript_14311/g.21588 Transcript_14311/m.21588 type:complete len:95 (-) Transcript_14311:2-286(-)
MATNPLNLAFDKSLATPIANFIFLILLLASSISSIAVDVLLTTHRAIGKLGQKNIRPFLISTRLIYFYNNSTTKTKYHSLFFDRISRSERKKIR